MAALSAPGPPSQPRRKQSIISTGSGNQSQQPGVANVGAAAGRRMSFAEVGLGVARRMSIISSMRRMSRSQPNKEPVRIPPLENTYKMKPDGDVEFRAGKVQKQIEDTLERYLDGKKYDKDETPHLSCLIASNIKNDVKTLGFNRHRIICQVFIGENRGQAVQCVSRPLWDDKTDSFAQASYRSETLFAVALIHGVYGE